MGRRLSSVALTLTLALTAGSGLVGAYPAGAATGPSALVVAEAAWAANHHGVVTDPILTKFATQLGWQVMLYPDGVLELGSLGTHGSLGTIHVADPQRIALLSSSRQHTSSCVVIPNQVGSIPRAVACPPSVAADAHVAVHYAITAESAAAVARNAEDIADSSPTASGQFAPPGTYVKTAAGEGSGLSVHGAANAWSLTSPQWHVTVCLRFGAGAVNPSFRVTAGACH